LKPKNWLDAFQMPILALDKIKKDEKLVVFFDELPCKRITKTEKHVFLTTISTFGVRQNAHSFGLIDRALDLDMLFEAV
jgi:hypothetical protein